MAGAGGYFGTGPEMQQSTGNGDQSTKGARSENIQHPGGAKHQIGNSIAGLFLQSAEERKQDFADLENADIHGLFKSLGDRVEADKLRRKKRTKDVAVRLARDQAAALGRKLPHPDIGKPDQRHSVKRGARQPFTDEPAGNRERQQQAGRKAQGLAAKKRRRGRPSRDQNQHCSR